MSIEIKATAYDKHDSHVSFGHETEGKWGEDYRVTIGISERHQSAPPTKAAVTISLDEFRRISAAIFRDR